MRLQILFAGSFILAFSTGLITTGMPLYLNALGYSFSTVGIVLSMSPLLLAMIRYLSAALSDLIDRHKTMIAAPLLQAAGTGLIPAAASVAQLAMLQIGIGAGTALQQSVAPAVIISYCDAKERASRLTIWQGMMTLGAGVGISVSGVIATLLGFSLLFLVSCLGCLLGALGFFLLKRNETGRPQGTEKVLAALPGRGHKDQQSNMVFRAITPSGFPRNIWVLFFAGLFFGCAAGIDMVFIPLYFRTVLALNIVEIGFIVAIAWFIYGFTNFATSKASDRQNPKRRYLFASLLSAAMATTISIAQNPILIVAAYMLFNITEGSRIGPRMRTIGDAVQPDRMGKDSVLPFVAFAIGNFASQSLGGIVADFFGFRPLFLFQAVFLLAELLIFLLFITGYALRPKTTKEIGTSIRAATTPRST